MTQYTTGDIDPDTTSGPDLADIVEQVEDASNTSHRGNSRPGYAVPGMLWEDSAASPSILYKWYDGTSDIAIWTVDETGHTVTFTPDKLGIGSAGSVSAPDFYILGDTNTGLRSPGADIMAAIAGGVEAFRWAESGGLVTVTFNATLDLDGHAVFTGGGDVDTEGGDVLSGGGIIDSEGGLIRTGGGDLDLEGGSPLNCPANIITQKTGSFTFAAAEADSFVPVSSASAVNATVPPNASVAFPVGTLLAVVQRGAGQVTWVPGSGVTLSVYAGLTLKSAGLNAISMALQISANTWIVSGALEAA